MLREKKILMASLAGVPALQKHEGAFEIMKFLGVKTLRVQFGEGFQPVYDGLDEKGQPVTQLYRLSLNPDGPPVLRALSPQEMVEVEDARNDFSQEVPAVGRISMENRPSMRRNAEGWVGVPAKKPRMHDKHATLPPLVG